MQTPTKMSPKTKMSTNITCTKLSRPLRRTAAALVCAALAGLGLAGAAGAQTATGPLTAPYTSPPQPTPFQWPTFHSGGGPVPAAQYPLGAPFLTPFLDPLQVQLQGTPTELYNGALTQIPSFSLGNFDPTRPPAGLSAGPGSINTFYPNHFADGTVLAWAAPFDYVAEASGTVTVDDTGAVAPNTFTLTGAWQTVTDPNGPTPGPITSTVAGTATNGEYRRLPAGVGNGTATWTLTEPTAGTYSLYFHIPNPLQDPTGTLEPRSTQVIYAITVRDGGGSVTATASAAVSQTEANDTQFLAGPLTVAAGGTVTVTLTRRTTVPYINYDPSPTAQKTALVADSMTLQQTVGDVQSAPTAITYERFPNEFNSTTHPLQYWGVFLPPGTSTLFSASPTSSPAEQATVNGNPDTTALAGGNTGRGANAPTPNAGNILLEAGNPAAALNAAGAPEPLRRIRQLVYFGRSDPAARISSSVDDNNAARFTGAGTIVSGTSPAPANLSAATASNGEYRSYLASGGVFTAPVATWTVPSPVSGTPLFAYVHIPANLSNETRLSQVYYTVTVNGVLATPQPVAISQVASGTDSLVALPTGPLKPNAGTNVVVSLYNTNGSATGPLPPTGSVVVADSVTLSTGSGQGAIYCVDGFTGGVIWRYETPGSANGPSSPVFNSPAIAKVNVLVTPAVYTAAGAVTTPATYANRLVVIVGDNNGQVYCLDAIGNGDGTSNVNSLAKDAAGNPVPNQPVTIPQPAYGSVVTPLVAGVPAGGPTGAAATAHLGTTGVYWIYRPDPNRPKYLAGTNQGKTKPIDATTDVPVPAGFGTASPTVFVDPTISTTPDATGLLPSNAIVYIGSSNGVLYALDALGKGVNTAPAATITPAALAASGDAFNAALDVQGGGLPQIPTPQPRWWFSLRGVNPNAPTNSSNADIESAPALSVRLRSLTVAGATTTRYVPTVYIGSAHEQEPTSNVGRLYALNGLYGPSYNGGRVNPLTQPNLAATGYTGPGAFNYNVGQVPQTDKNDTTDWSFPDANNTLNGPLAGFPNQSNNKLPRPALGNITGSPVVFTNIHDMVNPTRVYIAANSGREGTATARPDDTQTGRLWAINLDGTLGTTTGVAAHKWVYPLANDPNDAALDRTAEPYAPIGSFLRATPAIGFVQFPTTTVDGNNNPYIHKDAYNTGATGINGLAVPMLYVGTRGVNDSALYAVDIDGDMAGTLDTRTIYRQASPSGSIFQSSPALIANATSAGGNGGSVYVVAGQTMYDYSATPISNPFAGEGFPLIRQNRAFVGIGPISSPALAGADTTDLSQTFLFGTPPAPGSTNTSGFKTNTTDWVYVGDSGSGFCRGITPNDPFYGGIAVGLDRIVRPGPPALASPLLDSIIKAFLVRTTVTNPEKSATTQDAANVGTDAALPVYEWGESVYARFTNVAPPNPVSAAGVVNPALFVHDTKLYDAAALAAATATNYVPFYTSDGTTAQTVTFTLSDADATSGIGSVDSGSVNPRLIVSPNTPPDGFVKDSGPRPTSADFPDVTTNLETSDGSRYLGTYSYTIADGSARSNLPGARRRFQNVKQTVNEWDYTNSQNDGDLTNYKNYTFRGTAVITGDATNGNIITNPIATGGVQSFSKVAAVDQPIFGILNPLGVRGGGVPLLGNTTAAIEIGDELGPFRSVLPPPTYSTPPGGGATTIKPGDSSTLQALANGNDYPRDAAPPSSSGVGLDPTKLANAANGDPTGINAPIATAVVVTATGLIQHNTVGDNAEASSATPQGTAANGGNGLPQNRNTPFGGYGLDVFDRGALFNLGQTLRARMTVPVANQYAPPSGRDGMSWNSNFSGTIPNTPNAGNTDNTGHDAVVNYLPWETPPTPRTVGANGSLDYPDIAPGNIAQNLQPTAYGGLAGDLTANYVVLPPAQATGANRIQDRTVYGDPVQMRITVPNHQSANQQLYMKTGTGYTVFGETPPVNEAGASQITGSGALFPMGYVTSKRIFVPSANGTFYSPNRPYRDVRVYTGVPVDMRTSIANATTDIGKVPAAFGVQTEQYNPALNPLGLFVPNNPAFGAYFKPLEVHNDGNVNLLNIHFDQKIVTVDNNGNVVTSNTLPLFSDSADLLSGLLGYDLAPGGSTYGVTGPRSGTVGPNAIPEQPYLIRSILDTDLVRTYARNQFLPPGTYPGATFHKPSVGSDNSSPLTVPDVPENGTPGYAPATLPGPPLVSLALPFGTPVGTYSTAPPADPRSLRLFEGLDTAASAAYTTNPANILFPPKYGGAVGGIGTPTLDPSAANTGEPVDAKGLPEDTYNILSGTSIGLQPISTAGTQLTGTVVEQRLTDGATYGAIPMIDAGAAGPNNAANPPVPTATPDFGPAAFRDFATGDLSVYWASGRSGGYGLFGANLPFKLDPSTADPKHGHFLPTNPAGQWWKPFTPALAAGTNSGLSISTGVVTDPKYGFVVNVSSTAPYVNRLYSYSVNLTNGTLAGQQLITPPSSDTQVKYGVRGVTTPYADPVWAFWTGSTRGRTAISYNSQTSNGSWEETVKLLPVPAGLTSVADASPLLMTVPINGTPGSVIEVTYSGTAPDGNTDLYLSRYAPNATTVTKLDLVPFPAMTEDMKKVGGWYQARDVAWSRTGALNILVTDRTTGKATPLLYDTANAPLFTKAIYDQTSGLLVLTGVQIPDGTNGNTVNTVYVDAATGRVRFSPALLTTDDLVTPKKHYQNFTRIQATFSPLARRLTTDSRPDTAPVTFLDLNDKPNDTPTLAKVNASRRWTIWRKSGSAGPGNGATLYFKTQRLTLFLPTPVDPTKTITVKVAGNTVTSYDLDYLRGRIYLPIASGAEGQSVNAVYTAPGATTTTPVTDTVQWQDEQIANDPSGVAQPADSAAGLNTVHDYAVPLDTAINENNVAAFLDPFASATSAHKVWLFWNSTRNGTADIYSETIDPRFAPGP